MEYFIGVFLILAVITWLGGKAGDSVDDSFRKAYKKQHGHEPSEDEVKRHHDNYFEPHGPV